MRGTSEQWAAKYKPRLFFLRDVWLVQHHPPPSPELGGQEATDIGVGEKGVLQDRRYVQNRLRGQFGGDWGKFSG
jgi:hypothetical protein